ncbi:hypothetical protein [Sphingomonas sp. CFBP 8760]|uniref:hypothetical protein n=1 Tax=Sphingomonas sp. CFBP 8760 TaxID=2775282 RepID=UPI001A91255F|nr:hypothetical protein [Sphingomonas sp. CFBP 8760]
MGLLVTAGASAATRSPMGLRCTAVTTWACGEAKTCERRGSEVKESYSFDLVTMTYQAPHDRGAITEFEIDDGGFMTFVLGGGRRYVHKNADADDPMTSFLYMLSHDMRELQCNARYAPDASAVESGASRGLTGHYYLSGVMETGSELVLSPDGSFAWFMSHGAADQAAEGKWRIDGEMLVLDAGPSAGAEPAFRQLRLRIDHGALLLNGAGKGRYERHP